MEGAKQGMGQRASGLQAVIYCRISQDRDGEGLGVQRQEQDCRQLADKMGYIVVEVFVDNDVSAYSGRERPRYQAMLAALQRGTASAVICWHTDRLHRRPIELESYIDICEAHKVKTFAVVSGELDLETSDGRARARLIGTFARYESERKSERSRRKMEELVLKGKWTGGTRPFGWQLGAGKDGTPTLDPEEAEAVASAFQSVLEGRSLGSIVDSLNERGITTTTGKPWGYAQLRQMLKRARNAGLSEFKGEVVGSSEFPAIVSEDVWRAVVSILDDPNRRRSQSNKARHLLAGIAQCHCGALVRSATVRGRDGINHIVYRCPAKGPGHVGKRIGPVDDIVNRHAVRSRLVEETVAVAMGTTAKEDAERRNVQAEAEAVRARLEDSARMAAEGQITMTQLATMTAKLREKQDALQARMIELAQGSAAPAEPVAIDVRTLATVSVDSPEGWAWMGLSIDDRRDYVRRNFHVILYPHGKGSPRVFDPNTVKVHRRAKGAARGPLTAVAIAEMATKGRQPGAGGASQSSRGSD